MIRTKSVLKVKQCFGTLFDNKVVVHIGMGGLLSSPVCRSINEWKCWSLLLRLVVLLLGYIIAANRLNKSRFPNSSGLWWSTKKSSFRFLSADGWLIKTRRCHEWISFRKPNYSYSLVFESGPSCLIIFDWLINWSNIYCKIFLLT